MASVEQNQIVSVKSPLGDNVLLFRALQGREQLGRLFEYRLDLLSEKSDINLDDLVGQSITVQVEMTGGQRRFINGIVSRFAHTGFDGRLARYEASVVSWLWLLTRTTDCRIFQEMTVPDILAEVFQNAGFTDFDQKGLSGSYRKWTYCVQYRETTFNFVSRLMENEGIYYYFKHEEDKHTLMLVDSVSAHPPFQGHEKLSCFDTSSQDDVPFIRTWSVGRQVQPGKFCQSDYDYTSPKKNLGSQTEQIRPHDAADHEWYDFPGNYREGDEGDNYAQVRIEELQTQHEIIEADTVARGICTGHLFDLTNHARDDQNRQYLITSTTLYAVGSPYESMGDDGGATFSCGFTALDAQQPFRPARITPKPIIHGPQTAIVVTDGSEIYTNEFGCVKCHFLWDRHDEQNEKSSCWIRVAQIWASGSWGAMALPRKGDEVVVQFEHGDPDLPLIIGRVYNGDLMPPYPLPANKTQTGIKSRSSEGGSADNFNEIRMEDKIGSEQLYIHAEKNEDIVVENDKTEDVGHDETITIGNDRTETVGHDETITVVNDRIETVQANETLTVVADRTRNVNANESVTVALMRTHTVGINEAITVGAAQEVTVGGFRTVTVGLYQNTTIGISHTESVGANHSEDIGKDHSVKIGKNQSVKIGDNRSVDVGKDDTLTIKENLAIDAGKEILIKTGKASILMKEDGTITISGKDILIKGSGKITEKADGDVVIKGSKIGLN